MASVKNSLMDATVTAVSALGLTLGATGLTVVKRKLPRVGEVLEDQSLPMVFVVPPERPDRDEPFDTGGPNGRRLRTYLVEIVIVSPGDGDVVTDLDTYMEWRGRIAGLFSRPVPLDAGEMMTWFEPEYVLNREALARAYDYSPMAVRFDCVEEAE